MAVARTGPLSHTTGQKSIVTGVIRLVHQASVRAEMSHLFRTVRYLRAGHCRVMDHVTDIVLSGDRLVPG